jgi:hypothetical protein
MKLKKKVSGSQTGRHVCCGVSWQVRTIVLVCTDWSGEW